MESYYFDVQENGIDVVLRSAEEIYDLRRAQIDAIKTASDLLVAGLIVPLPVHSVAVTVRDAAGTQKYRVMISAG